MNKISSRLDEDVRIINEAVSALIPPCEPGCEALAEAMRYSAGAGGKRIRPVLALEFARMLGAGDRAVLPFAVAIELIHTYSLIHDDLPCMDNDDMRRGRPTNHKVFGEATALLAGDALLTLAFSVAASNTAVDDVSVRKAVRLLADKAGMNGMIGGQQLDLTGAAGDVEALLKTHSLKCGALIECACLLGVTAAGGSDADTAAASEYAGCLGVAFQIEDDIIDAGDKDDRGFLDFMTAADARSYAERLTEQACKAISGYPQSEFLRGLAESLVNRVI